MRTKVVIIVEVETSTTMPPGEVAQGIEVALQDHRWNKVAFAHIGAGSDEHEVFLIPETVSVLHA